MFIRRKIDKYVIAILAAGLFVYLSFQPVYRLRAAMPPEFAESAGSLRPPQRDAEERIAQAYWMCAVTGIQSQYGYGRQLPPDPPEEFQLTAQPGVNAAEAAAARGRYWRKLRQLWYVPTIWDKTYHWDFSWLSESLTEVGRWTGELWRKLNPFH